MKNILLISALSIRTNGADSRNAEQQALTLSLWEL